MDIVSTATADQNHSRLSPTTWDEKMLDQDKILREKEAACWGAMLDDAVHNTQEDNHCPRFWDGILCWPPTSPSSEHVIPCPGYVVGFNTQGLASRVCTENGTWFFSEQTNRTWTNYSLCVTDDYVTSVMEYEHDPNNTLIVHWLPVIKRISQVGYGVSLATLLIALLILASFKKLRCPRNTLHIHLFISFIMRAFMALLKNNLFVDGVGIIPRGGQVDTSDVFYNHSGWQCKLVTSLWQYFIMANYSWILMEGLYLHNLIFLALFTDSSAITVYIVLGWGLPLIFVSPWVILRTLMEDLLCWTTNDNVYIFWLIRGPITVSIVVNFVFFVHITWVLLLKLRSSVSAETRKYRYRKWAKSTLVLVPLFGVHYTVFGGMQGAIGVNETVEVVWLFCDQLFACFQGFFVAVLYCLLNGEVRGEIGRRWKRWRFNSAGSPWSCQNSVTVQSRFNTSRGRTSLNSLGATSGADRRENGRGSLTPPPVGRPYNPVPTNCSRGNSKQNSFRAKLEKIVSESEGDTENHRGPSGVPRRNSDMELQQLTHVHSMITEIEVEKSQL